MTLKTQLSATARELADEPPTQRPRLESLACVIRWSRTLTSLDTGLPSQLQKQKRCAFKHDPMMFSQQQVDDHIWENTGKRACLFQEEWSDLFGNTRDSIIPAYVNFNQSKDTGLTATKMTRNDEIPRRLIPDSEWPRFLQATVAEWTVILDTSAVTIISPAAAKDIREHLPHRTLPSRHGYRENPGEGVGAASKAKCRWCVLGHRDPDIRYLERSSPPAGSRPGRSQVSSHAKR